MRTLRCTSGEDAIVDDWNYDYLNQWNWSVQRGHVKRWTQEGIVFLHREVLRLAGHIDFEVGDHINRIPLDNREKNLRTATHSQNAQNRGIRCDNTTGFICVGRSQGKLCARVHLNGRDVFLGRFEDSTEGSIEAAQAADVGRIYFHDADFVVLNFKRSDYPPGHPDTWPPGPFSAVIRRCQGRPRACNNVLGYWYVAWQKRYKVWRVTVSRDDKAIHLGSFKEDSPDTHTALLQAVKVADIAAIHLGRDKINLGREHYPAGPPRDWPEDAIPNCPALRRLIHGD